MIIVYVLQLENDKYYVGKTTDSEFRLDQHFNAFGSVWTKKYNPIKVLEMIGGCDEFDEEKYTLKYMNLFGIDNVRGGSFCNENLTQSEIKTIEKSLNNANNKCFTCGGQGHFAKVCPNNYKQNVNKASHHFTKDSTSKATCGKCGRTGHTINQCYAKTTIDRKPIEYTKQQTLFGVCDSSNTLTEHTSNNCHAKTTVDEKPIINNETKCNIRCYHNKMIGFDSSNDLTVQGIFSINQSIVLEWVDTDHFRIRHPDSTNVYINNNLTSCTKENSQLFKIVDATKKGNMIETFIQCGDKFLWVDETWYGYNLRNDSINKNGWEKFFITIV